MVDRILLTSVLADLVSIESVNPMLVPGGSGEREIAHYVADFLKRSGIDAEVTEVSPGRFNVVGVVRGRQRGKTLMLNAHLDTVGVTGMDEPFSTRVQNACLYGRGALDMKGGLAAAMFVVAALAGEPLSKGGVVLAAVADEEYQSAGTRVILRQGVRPDAAIVLEPTNLRVATAHKGFVWAEVETLGRAAHGSRPEEGVDAIALMGRVLGEVEKLQQELDSRPPHPLLGCSSVHASLVSGGQELSSYPERCTLSLERRLLPGEDGATFERELKNIIARLSGQDPRFRARYTLGYTALALETTQDSLIAQTLMECVRKVLGPSAKFGAQSFWTDAALLSQAGIPSVLFGPGGEGLHSTVEYVRLDDVALCAEIVAECARAFCAG